MTAESGRPAELFALDPATCRTLLRTQHVGRLVTTGAETHVVPVNYMIAEAAVLFRTEPGTGAAQHVGRPALFEVDMFDERTRSGWSVVVRGRLMPMPPDLDPPDVESWAPGTRGHWLVVTIDTVSGRLLRGEIEAPSRPAGGYL